MDGKRDDTLTIDRHHLIFDRLPHEPCPIFENAIAHGAPLPLPFDRKMQVSGSRVQLAGERLPLVKRVPGTRILTPCALPCRVFNAHVQVYDVATDRTAAPMRCNRFRTTISYPPPRTTPPGLLRMDGCYD